VAWSVVVAVASWRDVWGVKVVLVGGVTKDVVAGRIARRTMGDDVMNLIFIGCRRERRNNV